MAKETSCDWGGREKITEKKKIRDGRHWKEVWPQQSSGRFQLVMETGVAHPAVWWQASLVLLTYIPNPTCNTATNSLHLYLCTPTFLPSYVHLFVFLFLHVFIRLLSLIDFYPLSRSLLSPYTFCQWRLTFDSFLRFIFLRHSERTAGHRGPCSNKQEAVWFAEGGDTP